mmetsp:Transcript_34278/g.107561  ORF Transcript_34278/g.107561 Transcript_34278/m.107561 type:complete len:115 (+) Transcript_34278:55-399(+)
MAQAGATLQNYNNDLVRCIEELREKREELNRSVAADEEEKGASVAHTFADSAALAATRLRRGRCRVISRLHRALLPPCARSHPFCRPPSQPRSRTISASSRNASLASMTTWRAR